VSAIGKAIPGSTLATSASLASEVSGSLSSVSKIATSLGKWLSVAALLVAFLIVGLVDDVRRLAARARLDASHGLRYSMTVCVTNRSKGGWE